MAAKTRKPYGELTEAQKKARRQESAKKAAATRKRNAEAKAKAKKPQVSKTRRTARKARRYATAAATVAGTVTSAALAHVARGATWAAENVPFSTLGCVVFAAGVFVLV